MNGPQEKLPASPLEKQKRRPIEETERTVSYLGVVLEKAVNRENAPKKEQFGDYILDRFSLELLQKMAVAFKQGDPLLIEGGTSIGKTRTAKYLAALTGYEVHYANLNGATDVEDLMGRYIPNHERKNPGEPEYVFADGRVTSGLRREPGKKKLIVLDEYNAAAPSIVIRLHEVLDALRQNGEVVLAEDASEKLEVSHEDTLVIALMNPPGKGYLERQPLDPAQMRRFIYQKEETELPKATAEHFTKSLFHLEASTQDIPESTYLPNNESTLTPEQLSDIPGIEQIISRYNEFHQGAKELLASRHIAKDQPQRFTYDDREEPRRVRDFILNFYRGDINRTMQDALRYFYAGKVLDVGDKIKLEELIRTVHYTPPPSAKRRSFTDGGPPPPFPPDQQMGAGSPSQERGEVRTYITIGGTAVVTTGATSRGLMMAGDVLTFKAGKSLGWPDKVIQASERKLVGFNGQGAAIIQLDGDKVVLAVLADVDKDFNVKAQPVPVGVGKRFFGFDGSTVRVTEEREKFGLKVGEKLSLIKSFGIREIDTSKNFEVVGFGPLGMDTIIQVDGGRVYKLPVDGVREHHMAIGGPQASAGGPQTFTGLDGKGYLSTGVQEYMGKRVGQELTAKVGAKSLRAQLMKGKKATIVGVDKDHHLIVRGADGITFSAWPKEIDEEFIVSDPAPAESKSTPEAVGKIFEHVTFIDGRTRSGGGPVLKSSDPGRKIIVALSPPYPEPGRRYRVRVVEDTKPEDPNSGQYVVEILNEERT